MRRRRVAGLLLLLSAACDGAKLGATDAGPPPSLDAGSDAPAEPIPPELFCDEAARIFCRAHVECCEARVYTDEESCFGPTRVRCIEQLDPYIGDRRTGYRSDRARQQLEFARTLASACDPGILRWAATREGMLSILQGTNPLGESCLDNPTEFDPGEVASCLEPTFCYYRVLDATCEPVSGEGGACRFYLNCRSGLFCEGGTLIADGACRPLKPAGRPCADNVECASYHCRKEGRDEGVCAEADASIYCLDVFGDPLIPDGPARDAGP